MCKIPPFCGFWHVQDLNKDDMRKFPPFCGFWHVQDPNKDDMHKFWPLWIQARARS